MRPGAWNGILLTYSGGFGTVGPRLAPDTATADALLTLGYGLAGCTRHDGWSVADGLRIQPSLVGHLREEGVEARMTLAWGSSMGGQIAAGLAEQAGDRFDGALSLCGSVAGAVGMLNQGLDGAFAALVLLGGDASPERFRPDDDEGWFLLGRRLAETALRSPEGRARLALACAVAQLPRWAQAGTRRPAGAMEALEQQAAVFPLACFSPRTDLVRLAGGQFSWNHGVDYEVQLHRSAEKSVVREAYAGAGLDLQIDLRALSVAPRVHASREAVRAMHGQLTPSGELEVPLVALHLIGDHAPVVAQSAAYSARVAAAGRVGLHRVLYLDGPGHCTETVDERVRAIEFLVERVRTGMWPEPLDEQTHGAGRFIAYEPPEYLRTDRMPPGS